LYLLTLVTAMSGACCGLLAVAERAAPARRCGWAAWMQLSVVPLCCRCAAAVSRPAPCSAHHLLDGPVGNGAWPLRRRAAVSACCHPRRSRPSLVPAPTHSCTRTHT